jgi:hypothetical protein
MCAPIRYTTKRTKQEPQPTLQIAELSALADRVGLVAKKITFYLLVIPQRCRRRLRSPPARQQSPQHP